MYKSFLFAGLLILPVLFSCSGEKSEESKGFPVNTSDTPEKQSGVNSNAPGDSAFTTRPGNILLTGNGRYRLIPVYKVNLNKKDKTTFIGSNSFHNRYDEYSYTHGNQWNENYMPGIEAVYGYNMVNISLFDTVTRKNKLIFEHPVLIKTLYYPSFSSDTLNGKPISRNYYLVSVYDEDSNKDGLINLQDLRRFYYVDPGAENIQPLVPTNYTVMSSEYDPGNDYMYVYARMDTNHDGMGNDAEEIHVFWIDLKNPKSNGRIY